MSFSKSLQDQMHCSSQGQSRRGYMGHLALLTKDIRQAFRRDDGLLKHLSMPSGWDSHMTKVDQRVENQITLNGDPVFWAAGYFHENDQENMVCKKVL